MILWSVAQCSRRAYFEISKPARQVVRRVNMKMFYGTENLPNVTESFDRATKSKLPVTRTLLG